MKDQQNLRIFKVPWIATLLAVVALKVLLISGYYSTDFEVHRNWLAITFSLPVSQWYTEATSEWTLDYPPFFAYFEWFLSRMAALVDPGMVVVNNLNYASSATIIFQRLSVILVDFMLAYAAWRCALIVQKIHGQWTPQRVKLGGFIVTILLMCNIGLIIVDSIHFQYNGFLFGIFLLSVIAIGEGRYLWAALLFAVVINFKHIFLYIAPAYFVYLLRNYCFVPKGQAAKTNFFSFINTLSIEHTLKLGTVVIGVFAVSFGPFMYLGQLTQLLSRLFPFKRGLTHAYWAPNAWSLYNFCDLTLTFFWKKFGWLPANTAIGYTTGLVQEYNHLVLFNVTPMLCLCATFIAMLPYLVILFYRPLRYTAFLRVIVLCAYASFLFGWHVHEKAILLIIIPQTLLAVLNFRDARLFTLLSTVGTYSLFPLLFTQFEQPIKYLLLIVGTCVIQNLLSKLYYIDEVKNVRLLATWQVMYLWLIVPLEFYCGIFHPLSAHRTRFPFLPLLLTSVYCAVGIFYCWIYSCWLFLCEELNCDQFLLKKFVWDRKQKKLSAKLIIENTESWQNRLKKTKDGFRELQYIGGLDIATAPGDESLAVVCFVLLGFPDLQVLHTEYTTIRLRTTYAAGYLAFREANAMCDLVTKLLAERPNLMPQVILVDGNGILHPHGFGLACHIGVSLNIPTIGVAKKLHHVDGLLKNKEHFEKTLTIPGQSIELIGHSGRVLGCAVRAADSKNPIFVSIGHKIDLPTAVHVVVECTKYRIPEPIRQADILSRASVAKVFV